MLMSDKIGGADKFEETPITEEAAEIRRQIIKQMNTKQAKEA